MRVFGILLFLIFTSLCLSYMSIYFKDSQFVSPIELNVRIEGNKFTTDVSLDGGTQYALVTSAEFEHAFADQYAKAPVLKLGGRNLELEGGDSSIANNLVLDWHWIKRKEIEYSKRYYGFFTLKNPCQCTLILEGIKPNYMNNYKVFLYESVDESYFIYGWLAAINNKLVIFFGFIFLFFEFLKRVKSFLAFKS